MLDNIGLVEGRSTLLVDVNDGKLPVSRVSMLDRGFDAAVVKLPGKLSLGRSTLLLSVIVVEVASRVEIGISILLPDVANDRLPVCSVSILDRDIDRVVSETSTTVESGSSTLLNGVTVAETSRDVRLGRPVLPTDDQTPVSRVSVVENEIDDIKVMVAEFPGMVSLAR